MHILQIIHLDIKPANIMYSKTFQKNVLLEFGIKIKEITIKFILSLEQE